MSLMHKIRGWFVDDYELKKDIVNFVAVSIYVDSIIRPTEVKKAYEVIESLFDGEDYEFLKEEIDDLLEEFQSDGTKFIEGKEKLISFVRNNKKIRKELIAIARLIFNSDSDLHKKEEEMLNLLEKTNKGV